ncbi:MAG: aminopeptidase [Oscillospiraceae bacterium]|nr:aminopeptidase [Oscillospiraceae bacterium]
MTAADLKSAFFSEKKNGGLTMSEEELRAADAFCEDYKAFLDAAKTEREAVTELLRVAEEKGFVPFEPGKKYVAGDKVYLNNRGKALILAVIGKAPLSEGINLTASHIDAPRIDLKQVPLYEDCGLALFKTHYYGGIKKYQWAAMPLALHGVIVKADMTTVTVTIGEDESDPVFCITDLLPHLAADQMKRPAGDVIKGEELNLLIGSRPFRDDEASEKVKLNIASILFEKYGITHDDFLSAELEIVPAFKAKDVGLDRSMVGAYGQDDRVCAYTSARAVLDLTEAPEKTMLAMMADKEEIGSCGATGMKGAFFKYFVDDLAAPYGLKGHTVLSASKCLSADVSAAVDPTFADVHERMNAPFVGCGTTIMKFTGSRGKGGSNDASAELMAYVRKMLGEGNVLWQTAELGKVDQGGGGTVASYIAELDVDTVDIGVPVLSMHAPFEVTSKIDIYATYKAFTVFNK